MVPESITEDVKSSLNFDSLVASCAKTTKEKEAEAEQARGQGDGHSDSDKGQLIEDDVDSIMIAPTSGYPDLAEEEATKRKVQRVVHEQESFWSWFCFRTWCDCCLYCPCPCDCQCRYCCHNLPVSVGNCECDCLGGESCADCCSNCADGCSCCAECSASVCAGLCEGAASASCS